MVSVVLESSNDLFIHVPKVAGGSISRALLSRPDAKRYAVTNMAVAIPCVEQLQKHLPNPLESYCSVACVRNPWDWTLSGYLQVTVNMPAFKQPPSFREFLLGGWEHATERVYPSKFSNPIAYVAYHTQISQWDHLGGKPGLDSVDYICRFESLKADLKKTSLPALEIPHIHRSERNHYCEYFDDELVDLVYERNRELIRAFGYEFEVS